MIFLNREEECQLLFECVFSLECVRQKALKNIISADDLKREVKIPTVLGLSLIGKSRFAREAIARFIASYYQNNPNISEKELEFIKKIENIQNIRIGK